MRANILLSCAIFIMTSSAVYAQSETDPSVLRKQIKDLESNIKDQYSEIEKLEKSIVKVRPEAEQAKRDAENIRSRRDQVKSDFEAFKYDEKAAALKSMQKEYKLADKSLSKYQKTGDNLKSKLSDEQTTSSIAAGQKSEKIGELDNLKAKLNGMPEAERASLVSAASDKMATETAKAEATAYENELKRVKSLEKEASAYDKTINKSNSAVDKIQKEITENAVAVDQTKAKSNDLKSSVAAREAELKQFDPKAVEKELTNLQKDLNDAELRNQTLQSDLDQALGTINQKHNLIEEQKKLVREKESDLGRK